MKMTDKEEKEFADAMNQWEEYKRKDAIKNLFKRSNYTEEYFELPFYTRWFCILKVLVCLVLKRTGGSYLDVNTICIIAYNEHASVGGYSGYDWDAVWVDFRFFRGWQVCIAGDGSY